MTQNYKPTGYSSVSIYLVAPEAQRVINFLAQTFGAQSLRRFDNPDGTIMHAEVRIDDTVVMIADAPADHTPAPAMVHVYVPDVDQTYQRALAAGGTAVEEPSQKDDPDRRGGVKDPAGNTWWLATMVGEPDVGS